MSAAALLQIHLEQAVLLVVAFALVRAGWARSGRRGAAPGRWRHLALAAIVVALVLPIVTRTLSRTAEPARSPARAPLGAARPTAPSPRAAASLPRPTYRWTLSGSGPAVARGVLALLAVGVLMRLAAAVHRQRQLRRGLEALPVMRRLGRVTVCASDLAAVPYAARARGRAFVVVPSDRLTDLPALRVLVAHELQHHRHRDLHVVRALEALRACFPWHPIVSTWARLVAELQEMACDAAVLQRGRVDRRAYVELLVSAAAASPSLRFVPRGVTAASGGSAAALRRRIDMMMNRRASRSSLARDLVLAAAGLAVVVSSAVAVRGAVVEPSLGSPDVAALSRKLAARGVTVPVNDVVLEEVDKWTSDAKNRAFLRESRRRLDVHRAMVETTLARHHVPSALAAVAVVESGFRRLEPKAGIQGAGVWQFIPATARRYGLEVKDGRDDRMDLDRETDAAARYLGAMNLEFQDWTLAVAGYSEGESAVARAAEAGNTRDAWELMRQGRISRYAATVLAAALVLEDPDRLLVD